MADRIRINERIRAREIRVVDDQGNQLGVMTLLDAMKLAREAQLDVVEISPTAVPPVCKLTDYGRYLYELNKKAHEQRKHQKGSQIKEVKFRPSTAEHDYQVRKRLLKDIGEHALVEFGPRMEANILLALLAPKKSGGTKPSASPA